MSEIKRVALSTFEPQKVNDKVNKKVCKTIRISVILPESNEDKCPEYNYKDQLAAVKKRSKVHKEPNNIENGVDPFADDDSDVRRIALDFEAKYGTGMKKKRKGKKDDYADIGMGYDESDSFIDNTDGYDEIIPQNVTTLHGGFYINCGALEFKTDDEASEVSSNSSDSEDDDKFKSNNRKRILESSDESEVDTASTSQLEKKPKLHSKNSMQQAIKKKLFSQNKIQVKKRRLIDPLKKTVKELLREKREDLNMSIPSELHLEQEADNMEKDSLKENKKPMSITSVTDAIESVVKRTIEVDYDSQNKQDNIVNKNDIPIAKIEAPSSVEGESSQDGNKTERIEIKLPENLPADILEIINKIKLSASQYKGEGLKKFFTADVNSMLLNLERKIKILGKSSRVKVYEHLSFFIKCRRETVSRRAKNLILEDEERKLKKMTTTLKDRINQIMPLLIMNYEQESQRIIQKKFSKESIDNEENKALKMPRKSFQWTEETRKLLKDILNIKKKCLLLEGKQKDNLEEQIVDYLKTKILPFWPEGWVHLNTLKKVYDNMTENTKMVDNNNSKPSSHKSHSNVMVIPTSNSKSNNNGNKDEIQNDITLTKITNEVRPSTKLTETSHANSQASSVKINNSLAPVKTISQPSASTTKNIDRTKLEKEHVEKSHLVQSSNIRESEKIKHDKDQDYKKASNVYVIQPSIIRESEKHRYETVDHDYRKSVTKPNIIQASGTVREGEMSIYEKDHDYKKTVLKPDKDHDYKKAILKLDKEHDYKKTVLKPDKEHDYKKIVLKPDKDHDYKAILKPDKEHDYKKAILKPDKDHDYKKAILKPDKEQDHKKDSSKYNRDYDALNAMGDYGVIVVNTQKEELPSATSEDKNEPSSVIPIPIAKHCQVIDLTDASDRKLKLEEHRPFNLSKEVLGVDLLKPSNSRELYPDPKKISNKHADFNVTPALCSTSTSKLLSKSDGDDIQMVMENLKALQKLSSPIKAENSTGSPVSVIAYNKSFSPKSNSSQSSTGQRTDFVGKNDFAGGFQDEFQKQFINSLQQLATSSNSSKSNYNRCS